MNTQAITQVEATAPAAWRRHGLLLLLTLLYIDTFVGRQIMAVMIEPIKAEFGVSDTAMGFVSGLAFAAVFALLGLSAGHLADRVARTRILTVCALVWGITTALCGLATGFYLLIAARMLVAVAETPISSASLSLISDLYPHHRRAFAISCYSSAPTFATIVAMSLGAWVVENWGWRYAFVAIAVPASLIAGVFFLFIREPIRGFWEPEARKIPARTPSDTASADTPGPKASGAVPPAESLGVSVRSLLAKPALRLLVLSSAITALGANAYGIWNATFLVRSHGLSLQDAGILAGVTGGGSAAIGMLLSGWLADKLIARNPQWQLRLPLTGHLLGFIAMVCYLFWPVGTLTTIGSLTVPNALLWCIANGFFAVWWVGPCFSLLTRLAPVKQRAVALALQTVLITLLGVGAGPFLVGFASDQLASVAGKESLRYALLLISVSTVIAMLMLVRIQLRYSDSVRQERAV